MMLSLVLISTLTLALNIQPVKASGTIYIRADGSIDPPTAPISTDDNVTYTFTGGKEKIFNHGHPFKDDILLSGFASVSGILERGRITKDV